MLGELKLFSSGQIPIFITSGIKCPTTLNFLDNKCPPLGKITNGKCPCRARGMLHLRFDRCITEQWVFPDNIQTSTMNEIRS